MNKINDIDVSRISKILHSVITANSEKNKNTQAKEDAKNNYDCIKKTIQLEIFDLVERLQDINIKTRCINYWNEDDVNDKCLCNIFLNLSNGYYLELYIKYSIDSIKTKINLHGGKYDRLKPNGFDSHGCLLLGENIHNNNILELLELISAIEPLALTFLIN